MFVLGVGREIPILIRYQTPPNYDDQRPGDNQYYRISPQPFEEMLVATPKAWDCIKVHHFQNSNPKTKYRVGPSKATQNWQKLGPSHKKPLC